MTDHSELPGLDEARQRLVRRFGDDLEPWMTALPDRLLALRERWSLELGAVVPRGSMSVVLRCRTAQGHRAMLKISPDRERVANEISALAFWSTSHVPTVLRSDPSMGALLMEEIEPGIPLMDAGHYPALGDVTAILKGLHAQGVPGPGFPSVADRVAYLFAAWARERQRHPIEMALVPQDLFDRGRRLALRLADEASPTVLLHGDFTPVNILDGGAQRGLVAIDPCPTLGDPAFDAIDLLLWQAGDLKTVEHRAKRVGWAIGVEISRLLEWCTAFGGMVAADLEATGQRAEPPGPERDARVRTALNLAALAPSL